MAGLDPAEMAKFIVYPPLILSGWGMGHFFPNLLPFLLKSLCAKTWEQTAYHLDNHGVIIKSQLAPALLCVWISFSDPTLTMNSTGRIYRVQNSCFFCCCLRAIIFSFLIGVSIISHFISLLLDEFYLCPWICCSWITRAAPWESL